MPAHLMPLPKCRDCGAPASDALRNTWNAIVGYYCKRHGPRALKIFKREYEDG